MGFANSRDVHGRARRGRRSAASLLLAAEEAVDLGAGMLRRGRANLGALVSKGDRDFATDVDLQIETAMRRALATAAPAIPFLGEEEGGAPADGSPRWVLDPIDGTINFAKGSPLCSISLSLVVEGQPVLGIVDAPLLGERFIAQDGAGAFLNGAPLAVCDVPGLHEAIVAVADFKVGAGSEEQNRVHLAVIEELARRALRVRMHGSAALDLAWLAAGRVHATIMLSNLPWDVTAGLLIVREAGGTVCDADGSPHDEHSRTTLASTPSLGDTIPRLVTAAM